MKEIFTAVRVNDEQEQNLDQPLLSKDEKEEQGTTATTTVNGDEVTSLDIITGLYPSFRLHGTIIGFLVQLLNVAGSTVLFYQWEGVGLFSRLTTDPTDTLLHLLVYLLTQVDLYLYLFMWFGLTVILTQPGMQYVQENYFPQEVHKNLNKRSVFVLGVQFYVGVVVGVFLAWTSIDCVLGLPVPILPMLGVLFFGLLISYTMIYCYDLEDAYEKSATTNNNDDCENRL